MSNYIGKISAIVTANTSDLSRKLGGARNELNAFGRSIQSSIGSANRRAAQSFNEIFTPLQRLQRALAAANRNPLDLRIDTTKVRELSDAANGLARPLAAAAKQFDQLGASVQQAFGPALNRAQGEVLDVQGFIERFGRVSDETFVRVQRRVLDAATALNQLSQAQQRLNSLATGNELQFSDPRLAGNLAAAQRAGQNALSLSPGQIQADPQIERLVRDIGELSERAVAAAANVKNIRLSGGDTRAALAQYEDINDELGVLISRLNKKYTLIIDTEAAKKNAREIREALAFTVTGRARNFDQLTSQIQSARGEVEKFDAVQRRAFAKDFGRLSAIIRTNDVANLEEASAILDRINRLIGARKQYDIDTAESDSALQRLQERLGSIAESLRRTPSDEFDRLEQSANEARAAIDKVADARARASLNRRAALVEGGIRADAANPALTDAERRRRAGLDAAALGAIGRDAAESDRRAREAALTRNAGAGGRVIDRLGPSVTALRGQLTGLAEPLRASIGPEVDRLQTKFQLLARAGIAASAEEVQRLKGEIAGLNAALSSRQGIGQDFLKSFGGAGTAGLSLGVDERSLRAIGGQIEFVQNRLSLLGQEARGPVLAALEALRVRANALFQGGAIDTEEARNELALLRQDLIRTLAAAEGGGTAGIEAGLNRAGDVGRLGVDKLQLGLQQAAFAVDDFFSVTGDLQQRIRAVGNNLTQLGFIVGNTKGLWIALGGVLALQVISQIIKYANANVEAADRTKALNEALARQKNLVEELAQAFRSLGDTILRGVFTPAADEARQFAQALEEIRKKQAEVRESRLTEFNPDVVQRRAEVQARQREFDAATTPEARLAAATALRQAREREQEAVRAAARPIPARRLDEEIQQAVQRSIDLERRSRTDFDTGALLGEDQFLEALRRGGRQAEIEAARAAGDGLGANRIQREELQTRLREVEALGDGPDSRQAALILRGALERLNFAEALGLDDAATEIFKDAQGTSTGIREAREKLSEAIEAGVPGARAASEALNAAGESLSAAQQRIIDRVEAGLPVDRELVDAARGEREAAQKALEARQKEVVAFDSTRRSLETFSAALDRVSTELANTVAQEARGLADQARRDANREQGIVDGGLGGRQGDADAAARRRDRLAAEANDFARRAAAIEAANTRARVDFARQAAASGLGQRAQDLIRRRDQAQAVIDNRQSPADDVTNAQATLNIINTELQQIFEQSGAGQAAAKLADELNKAAAAAARRDELIERGRELDLSPAEQAGRELAEDIRAINERFAADAAAAPADRDRLLADAQADIARVREDAVRAQAPAIFGLADQVQNAVLQGPSRAALEAADVSTVEGARELNRLLRGDDAARDQDLVQLQREANRLLQLIAEGNAPVAN